MMTVVFPLLSSPTHNTVALLLESPSQVASLLKTSIIIKNLLLLFIEIEAWSGYHGNSVVKGRCLITKVTVVLRGVVW